MKCQYFSASFQPGVLANLTLSLLPYPYLHRHKGSASLPVVTEDQWSTKSCKYPSFKSHQFWIWDWSSSSEIQIPWASSIDPLSKIHRSTEQTATGSLYMFKEKGGGSSKRRVLRCFEFKFKKMTKLVALTERWITTSAVPQDKTAFHPSLCDPMY